MNSLSLKQKIIAAVIAVGIALILLFNAGLGGKSETKQSPDSTKVIDRETQTESATTGGQESRVKSQEIAENIIVSTKPAELIEKKDLTVLPTQVIEITFNHALENVPETRIVFEPKVEFRAELSSDQKTVKITPDKPFALGQGYTLFIKGATKFKDKGQLGSDLDFHFTTIAYRGV